MGLPSLEGFGWCWEGGSGFFGEGGLLFFCCVVGWAVCRLEGVQRASRGAEALSGRNIRSTPRPILRACEREIRPVRSVHHS